MRRQVTRGHGRTDAEGQGTTCTTDDPPAVLHEERAEGAADGPHLPQSASAEECAHPDAATSPARVRTHDNPPPGARETEDFLASIFSAVAPMADQGLQTDEQCQDDESFAAVMASCWDRAPTKGPATTSALRHVMHNTEPTSPARDPASEFPRAHLRRNYAALGSAAQTHATTAGDAHAGGQPEGITSQRPRAKDAPVHGVRAPVATGTVSGPLEGVPPRMTRPWGQESLDYEHSKGDAKRPTAEADWAAALDLDPPDSPDLQRGATHHPGPDPEDPHGRTPHQERHPHLTRT